MRSTLLIIVAAIVLAGFLVFMTTYSVRFTDAAVVTTFGRAGEDSVVTEPGLRFKWPTPIQSTTVYDKRLRVLKVRDETQQTADQRQIIVGAFLAWNVEDPLLFYSRQRGAGNDPQEQYRSAEQTLTSVFRSAMAEVNRYRLDELFIPGEGAERLAALERSILDRLNRSRAEGGDEVSQYGVSVRMVGINRIELPESVTRDVLEQMRAEREQLAAEAESRGQAIASAIEQSGRDDARKILSFAEQAAADIRNRGEREAAEFREILNQEPRLAIFLSQIELMRESIGRRTTLILSPRFPGFELFGRDGLERFMPDPTDSEVRVIPMTSGDAERISDEEGVR